MLICIFQLTPRTSIMQISISGIWIFLTIGWIYFFSISNYRLLLGSATIFFYVGLQKFKGGAEMLISKVGLEEWNHKLSRKSPIANGHSKNE